MLQISSSSGEHAAKIIMKFLRKTQMPIEEENMSKKENLKQDKKMIKHGKKIIYSGCAIKVSSRYRKS